MTIKAKCVQANVSRVMQGDKPQQKEDVAFQVVNDAVAGIVGGEVRFTISDPAKFNQYTLGKVYDLTV